MYKYFYQTVYEEELLVIYDLAPDPTEFPNMRKILFYFLSVYLQHILYLQYLLFGEAAQECTKNRLHQGESTPFSWKRS
jgi:hypothetical protein